MGLLIKQMIYKDLSVLYLEKNQMHEDITNKNSFSSLLLKTIFQLKLFKTEASSYDL